MVLLMKIIFMMFTTNYRAPNYYRCCFNSYRAEFLHQFGSALTLPLCTMYKLNEFIIISLFHCVCAEYLSRMLVSWCTPKFARFFFSFVHWFLFIYVYRTYTCIFYYINIIRICLLSLTFQFDKFYRKYDDENWNWNENDAAYLISMLNV